jgi:hypothetical protein
MPSPWIVRSSGCGLGAELVLALGALRAMSRLNNLTRATT